MATEMIATNDDIVQIRPIAAKDIYPIRRAVLYPAGPDDMIYIPEDDTAIHLGAHLITSPELSQARLAAVISLFNEDFPSHLQIDIAPSSSDSDSKIQLSPALRFRKFACLQEFQNRGIGSRLFRSVLDYARDDSTSPKFSNSDTDSNSNAQGANGDGENSSELRGPRMVWCAARSSAKDWYIKRGMKVYGDAYLKNNIEYVIMGIVV